MPLPPFHSATSNDVEHWGCFPLLATLPHQNRQWLSVCRSPFIIINEQYIGLTLSLSPHDSQVYFYRISDIWQPLLDDARNKLLHRLAGGQWGIFPCLPRKVCQSTFFVPYTNWCNHIVPPPSPMSLWLIRALLKRGRFMSVSNIEDDTPPLCWGMWADVYWSPPQLTASTKTNDDAKWWWP